MCTALMWHLWSDQVRSTSARPSCVILLAREGSPHLRHQPGGGPAAPGEPGADRHRQVKPQTPVRLSHPPSACLKRPVGSDLV